MGIQERDKKGVRTTEIVSIYIVLDYIKTTDQLSLCFAVVRLPDNITGEKKDYKYDGGGEGYETICCSMKKVKKKLGQKKEHNYRLINRLQMINILVTHAGNGLESCVNILARCEYKTLCWLYINTR